MSPILGIYASQISGHLGIPIISSSDYYSIATTTVGSGGASSITFASIPSTYTHLQIRGISRETSAGYDQIHFRLNGDTGNNYSRHVLYGDGSSVYSDNNTTTNDIYAAPVPGPNQSSGVFNALIIDILDYANTNKYKTTRSLGGADGNGSGYIFYASGLWMNTSATTSVTLYSNGSSANLAQYSTFALYGVK